MSFVTALDKCLSVNCLSVKCLLANWFSTKQHDTFSSTTTCLTQLRTHFIDSQLANLSFVTMLNTCILINYLSVKCLSANWFLAKHHGTIFSLTTTCLTQFRPNFIDNQQANMSFVTVLNKCLYVNCLPVKCLSTNWFLTKQRSTVFSSTTACLTQLKPHFIDSQLVNWSFVTVLNRCLLVNCLLVKYLSANQFLT